MENQLKKIMSGLFNVTENDIIDETSIDNVESWNSLNHLKLIVSIEKAFNISLEVDEIVDMTSFGKIKSILGEKGI